MTRSIWKAHVLYKKNRRAQTILPGLVGKSILLHNGKTYKKVTIHQSMIGHKLGEFYPTRKYPKHKKK